MTSNRVIISGLSDNLESPDDTNTSLNNLDKPLIVLNSAPQKTRAFIEWASIPCIPAKMCFSASNTCLKQEENESSLSSHLTDDQFMAHQDMGVSVNNTHIYSLGSGALKLGGIVLGFAAAPFSLFGCITGGIKDLVTECSERKEAEPTEPKQKNGC